MPRDENWSVEEKQSPYDPSLSDSGGCVREQGLMPEQSSSPAVRISSDGRVELSDESIISSSSAYNRDLAPVPISKRNWSAGHYAALWAGMVCSIPTFMAASALVADGMTFWQAMGAVLLGNLIVLIPITLNSHAGTKYGIPFPVLIRASYGIRGSNFPALMRALVACGWFGINAWLGGQAFFYLIKALVPSWQNLLGPPVGGHTPAEWFSFLAFWAINIFVIYRGMDFLKKFETLAAPFVFVVTLAMAAWLVVQAHGPGMLISADGKYTTPATFLPVFVSAVTAMIGSWSTLSLNMPDFTRFSRSQKDQIAGQVTALPLAMTAFAGMGVLIASAGAVIYPTLQVSKLWNPITLVGQCDEPLLVVPAMFVFMLATLSANVAANLVSPANDFSNCFPNWISFRRGALLTGLLGLVIQPWTLLDNPHAYVFTFLQGYAGGMASIAGVMIADYWIIRKRELVLPDLYLTTGRYWFFRGWNSRAVAATLAGCGLSWIGLVIPGLRILYDFSWFLGLSCSGLIYWMLSRSPDDSLALEQPESENQTTIEEFAREDVTREELAPEKSRVK